MLTETRSPRPGPATRDEPQVREVRAERSVSTHHSHDTTTIQVPAGRPSIYRAQLIVPKRPGTAPVGDKTYLAELRFQNKCDIDFDNATVTVSVRETKAFYDVLVFRHLAQDCDGNLVFNLGRVPARCEVKKFFHFGFRKTDKKAKDTNFLTSFTLGAKVDVGCVIDENQDNICVDGRTC